MRYSLKKAMFILAGSIMFLANQQMGGQTIIKPGEVSGIWSKKSSPYLINGDLNIPAGKTLTIQPGVTLKFTGLYTLNVQGNLVAIGTKNDSIVFTALDTAGIKDRKKIGWNGIRFDRRPVKWDTLKFRMPEDEELKTIIETRIREKDLDTTTKISLIMNIPDEVNDMQLPDSIFCMQQGSLISFCKFEYATAEGKAQPYVFGGAMYIYRYSNLIISDCLFQNNFAYAGGAIYCKEAAPVIIYNRIINCSAQSSGGAMVFIHSGPIVMNNTIKNNASGFNGGAIMFYESYPYVVNNIFLRNKAINSGGAIYCEQKQNSSIKQRSYPPAKRVKFPRNALFEKANLNPTLLTNSTSYYGRFINNVICQNNAAIGGGVSLSATMPEFTNITLSDNTADSAGGGIYCESASPQLTNSIIYDNTNDQVYLVGNSNPMFRYCSIESALSGIKKDSTNKDSFEYTENNSNAPQYANSAIGDYSLESKSGSIDEGIRDTASLRLPMVDLSGKDRVANGRIDIGALEYPGDKSKTKSTEDEDKTIEGLTDVDGEMYASIFPNPNNGKFFIVIHNNIYESINIKIISSSGQIIYLNKLEAVKWFEKEIDLSGVNSGIYVIMIYSGDSIVYNGELIIY